MKKLISNYFLSVLTGCLLIVSEIQASSPTHFTDVILTDNNCAYVGKVIINGVDAIDGNDELGVYVLNNFNENILIGSCVIGDQFPGFYFVNVYGDDSSTSEKDGAAANDELIFKIWDKSSNIEYIIESSNMEYQSEPTLSQADIPPKYVQSNTFGFINFEAKNVLYVSFEKSTYSVFENAGMIAISVVASVYNDSDISVPYTVTGSSSGNGVDHNLDNGNINIESGQLSGTKSFQIFDDEIHESIETIIITLEKPINANLGTSYTQTISIIDNDIPVVDEYYTITINTVGNGNGSISQQTQTVLSGSSLTVVATPDDCSTFDGWSGDFSGTGNAVLTDIQSNKTITASFSSKTFTVTINKTGTGSGSLSKETQIVNCGDSLIISAAPDDCSIFDGWSGDFSGTGNATLTDIQANKTITALFSSKTFTVTINKTGTGSGSISQETQIVNCGDSLTISATPDGCSTFYGWSGDFAGTGNAVLTDIQANKTITASFSTKTFTVTINKSGTGSGSLSKETQIVNCGDSLNIAATPDEFSIFDGWSGDASGTANAILTNIQSDKTITASFSTSTKLFTVTINKTGTGSGLLSKETQTVNCGDSLTIAATPDDCSTFDGWSGDASGTGNAILTDIQSNKTITALFSIKTYTVTINKINNDNILLSSKIQTVNCGDSITVVVEDDNCSKYDESNLLDIDGNGTVLAATDGLLLLRYLFELRGESLINGVIDKNKCVRCNAASIESHLQSLVLKQGCNTKKLH